MLIKLKNKDTLIVDDFKFKCCIGKNGINKQKIEGDKSTPVGIFSINKLYYRADRKSRPITKIKKVTGRRLQEAWQTIPHVTQHDESDITELDQFRKKIKKRAFKKWCKSHFFTISNESVCYGP